MSTDPELKLERSQQVNVVEEKGMMAQQEQPAEVWVVVNQLWLRKPRNLILNLFHLIPRSKFSA